MARRKTGSIQKRGPGKYQVQVSLNKHYLETYREGETDARFIAVTGRQGLVRRRSETVVGTREDAERRLHELQHQALTGTMPTGKVMLNDWLEYWLQQDVEPNNRPRTVDDYRRQVRVHIGPALGSMYLHDIRPHHLQEFQRRKDKAGLSRSSITKLYQILNLAFAAAWRHERIPENPMAKVKRLASEPKRPVEPLSMDRVQQIIAEAEARDDRWHVLYRLMACTGLRIGEALALKWEHTDLVGKRIEVRHTTTVGKGGRFTLGPPKSKKSNRDVPINDALVAALLTHREAQDAILEQAGDRYDDWGLVFPKVRVGQQGGILANRQVQRALRAYGTHPHALRHFFGTQMFEAGASLLRVSRLMGHANVGITAAIYVHPDAAGDREAIDLLTARMAGPIAAEIAAEELEALLSDTDVG